MSAVGPALTARGAVAALVPLAVLAALAWPRAAAGPADPQVAPPPDTSAVRRAALELAERSRAAPTPAPASSPAPSAAGGAREPPTSEAVAARVQALGALTERIYAARDVRRKAGLAGAELRKPFTVDELGGAALVKELDIRAGHRLLVLRDGAVLWPAGQTLPDGVRFDPDPKAHASALVVAAGGQELRAVRYCPYGEVTCLVDLSRSAAPTAETAREPAAAPAAPAAAQAAWDTGALDAALEALARDAAPRAPAAVSAAAGIVPFGVAWSVALALAIAGLLWLSGSANRLARALVGASARLRQLAAGRAPDAAPGDDVRELRALHDAITAAARGLAEAQARQALDDRRRARADDVAQTLARAAGSRDLSQRIRVDDVDDASLLALVDGANRLLESLDRSVLRWKSHAGASMPRAENARALEARADALRPLPPLLADTAERVLRLSHVEGAPTRLAQELHALGEALGQRARTAQALLDALLLDLATERPQGRHDDALALLRQELSAFTTSGSAPERVAALRDLSPSEIGERVAAEGA